MFENHYTYLLLGAIIGYGLSLVLHFADKPAYRDAAFYTGFLAHTIFTLSTGYLPGIYLVLQVVENPSYLPWSASFLIFIFKIRKKSRHTAWNAAIIVPLVFAVIALLTPRSMTYFGPNKLTVWATFYFLTEFFSHACFFIGGVLAAMFLAGRDPDANYHTCLVWGFVAYTLSHVVGSIWCFLGWAATFQWVYVHLKAAAIWVFYANYLHLRFLPQWSERKRAWYAAAGAVLLAVFKYAL